MVAKDCFSNGIDYLASHTMLGRIKLMLIWTTFLTDEYDTLFDPAIFLLYGIIHHYWLYRTTTLQLNIIGRTFQPEMFFAAVIKKIAVRRKNIAEIFLYLLLNLYNGIYLCVSLVLCMWSNKKEVDRQDLKGAQWE